jgi:hypothetical protein
MWCGAGHVQRKCPRKEIHLPPQHAVTVSWRKEKNTIPQIIRAADMRRRRCRKRSCRGHPGLHREVCSLPTSPLEACLSRRRSEARQRNSNSLRHIRWQVPPQWNQVPLGLNPTRTTESRSVSSGSECKQFVSGQNIESSSNGRTADYDSIMML